MEKKLVKDMNMSLSKSFRKGFLGGILSPGNLFLSPKIQRPAQYDGSVARAWRQVGVALSDATRKEGESIGKTSRNKKRRSNIAA
ncbi:hypothetical protein [Pararhizobium antarcticum]|uniref:Uncharacterized protein n=1 Tax=Pararhizobium antarcticum TaxID=1798805 RepID=A0A657LSW4_9HYPH|nr:hypothetical protein [Pararhizobium antarcticum]OJF97602.1 hypothetical protein AX760_16715 [Pararhizobium antarcticum]